MKALPHHHPTTDASNGNAYQPDRKNTVSKLSVFFYSLKPTQTNEKRQKKPYKQTGERETPGLEFISHALHNYQDYQNVLHLNVEQHMALVRSNG